MRDLRDELELWLPANKCFRSAFWNVSRLVVLGKRFDLAWGELKMFVVKVIHGSLFIQ